MSIYHLPNDKEDGILLIDLKSKESKLINQVLSDNYDNYEILSYDPFNKEIYLKAFDDEEKNEEALIILEYTSQQKLTEKHINPIKNTHLLDLVVKY